MAEEKKVNEMVETEKDSKVESEVKSTSSTDSKPERKIIKVGGDKKDNRKNSRDRRDQKKEPKEYDEVLLEVRKVTRVTTGWRKLSFRAIIVVWNRKGKIWLWIGKSLDVLWAVQKATHDAYKAIKQVPLNDVNTIPYETLAKYKSATIKLLPASSGTGLKAGSSVRTVLELAGYNNILSKILGSNNKLNNAIATINALTTFKAAKYNKNSESKKSNKQTEEVSN